MLPVDDGFHGLLITLKCRCKEITLQTSIPNLEVKMMLQIRNFLYV